MQMGGLSVGSLFSYRSSSVIVTIIRFHRAGARVLLQDGLKAQDGNISSIEVWLVKFSDGQYSQESST